LEINQPGMLVHDFPDTLSEGGWYHNFKPMNMDDNEIMTWGTPSNHPRQRDGQSEPKVKGKEPRTMQTGSVLICDEAPTGRPTTAQANGLGQRIVSRAEP